MEFCISPVYDYHFKKLLVALSNHVFINSIFFFYIYIVLWSIIEKPHFYPNLGHHLLIIVLNMLCPSCELFIFMLVYLDKCYIFFLCTLTYYVQSRIKSLIVHIGRKSQSY